MLDVVGCKAVVSGIFPDSMVQELKQAYHLMRGITVDNQMLVFQGRQLQSDKNLSSYGIEHDSTIIIREVRLRPVTGCWVVRICRKSCPR